MRQELILNENGQIIESDNQLFPIQVFSELSALECFPLVASMFPSLLEMDENAAPILIPSVSPRCDFLSGFFDFSFSKISSNGKIQIHWVIEDQTTKYTKMKDEMQIYNDEVIKEERERLKGKFG